MSVCFIKKILFIINKSIDSFILKGCKYEFLIVFMQNLINSNLAISF